ncbi:MAG: YggS family pyridoxal phosphate-dependent enzyme [Gammaproteobacteria bacterium]|nr:YggS family pyridoxal phosphate-dependent enzyme [Gammaproteobacteria bacterium]
MLTVPQNLPENVQAVRRRIAAAAERCGRSVDRVTLLAVSKGQPAGAIETAARCGLADFGESYLQEALPKIRALSPLGLTWHFIGPVQANKTRSIAETFAWVHSVDRPRVAERLAAQRPFHAAPLQVCIQVNIAGEHSKSGVAPEELDALVSVVRALPRLRLRGLMCLPPQESGLAEQQRWFAATRGLLERLNSGGADLDTLSMGMSSDLEAAIAEGSTMVRIGTAIFGARA